MIDPMHALEILKGAANVALNYFAYNFVQIHKTLRTSPQWPLASQTASGA